MSGIHQPTAQRGKRSRVALSAIRSNDKFHEPFFFRLVVVVEDALVGTAAPWRRPR